MAKSKANVKSLLKCHQAELTIFSPSADSMLPASLCVLFLPAPHQWELFGYLSHSRPACTLCEHLGRQQSLSSLSDFFPSQSFAPLRPFLMIL